MKPSRPRGAFALVPDASAGQLTALLVDAVASSFVFSGYIIVWRGERAITEDSANFEMLESFSFESQKERIRQLQTLPRPARTLHIAVGELFVGAFYLLPRVPLGIALAVANAFHPIPEGHVFVGLVSSYMPTSTRLAAFLPAPLVADIEFRIADETTDVVQNLKSSYVKSFMYYGTWSRRDCVRRGPHATHQICGRDTCDRSGLWCLDGYNGDRQGDGLSNGRRTADPLAQIFSTHLMHSIDPERTAPPEN